MQDEFRKCRLCGQIYRHNGQPFCSACVFKMDEDFKIIKDYLYENPNATVLEVVEETGVEEKTVFYLLKEGRLEMKSAAGFLTCMNCGAPVRSGTLCEKCAKKLSSVLESVIDKNRPAGKRVPEDKAKTGRMYTDGRRKQI